MRPASPGLFALAALLGCSSRLGDRPGDRRFERSDIEVSGRPLADEQQARLVDLAREQGHLYWRLPGDDGPRCEPWRLVPDGDGPERGRLVFAPPAPAPAPVASDSPERPPRAPPAPAPAPVASDSPERAPPSPAPAPVASDSPDPSPTPAAPPASPGLDTPVSADMPSETSTLRLAYRLLNGHLSLTAPEHERPLATDPNDRRDVVRALTCVFTGVAIGGTGAGRIVLVARERFFFTAAACAAAGPADEPPGPDELRAVGCAGALADLATRARLDRPPPAAAPDAAARLHRARRVHVLRRGPDGRARCDAWRNLPETGPGHGRLVHRGRDEHGDFTRTYAYDVGPGYLTLQGPADVRRLEPRGRRGEVVQASGCLLTRAVTAVTPTDLTIGPERWYLSRRACEQAGRAVASGPLEQAPLLVPACE